MTDGLRRLGAAALTLFPAPALSDAMALALALGLSGCGDAERLFNKWSLFPKGDQTFTPVPGEPIAQVLEPVVGQPEVNVAGHMAALDVAAMETAARLFATNMALDPEGDPDATMLKDLGLLAEAGAPQTATPGAVASLTEGQKTKMTFDSRGFKRDTDRFYTKTPLDLVPSEEFSLASETVSWTAPSSSFTVSVLAKMPVRDQGQRGTCAAHAGVGQLEGYLLKKYPDLKGIDLSEQRFYYLSKPEHWGSGGDPNDGGSNSGSGFATSARYDWTKVDAGWVYPQDFPSSFNIPLESKCRYNPKGGSNDLQIPQNAGCSSGVVRVTSYASWVRNASQDLKTPQEIYDFLLQKDYPVITGTRLSDNWEDNDGMITLKEAGQPSDSIHAGGHAYLIVGAKKLDESQYPGEGGMCFVILNSWGKGWGVNGLSCMTLAWFNAWRFKDSSFGLITNAEVDTAALNVAASDEDKVPDDLKRDTEPSDDTVPSGQLTRRRGTARIASFTALEDESAATLVDPAKPDGYDVGRLIAANDQAYKILYKVDGDKIRIQGVLAGQTKTSKELILGLKDGRILTGPVGDREAVPFGEWNPDTKQIILCSKGYSQVCDLNYVAAQNQLVAGPTEFEATRDESEGPYDWQGTEFQGYGIEVSVPPGQVKSLDLRFKIGGQYTNPQRFAVDPLGGAITWHQKVIGNYQKLALCSGEFQSLCRIVVAQDRFHVLFKAKKP